ncbi:MAG: hypothetical protein ACLQMF_02930 [Rectinemataceae bacterium]
MKTTTEKTSIALFKVEKRLNHAFASNFKSSPEHWTLLDTIRHANMWKMSALEIVKKRIDGKDAQFHKEIELEEIDQEIYMVTNGENCEQTEIFMDQVAEIARSTFKRIRGNESDPDLSPLGFDGNVIDYLLYTLVQRPIRRYLYYGIRNDEYELFSAVEKFVRRHGKLLLIDKNVFDLSIFQEAEEDMDIFDRSGKWIKDELYAEIRKRTRTKD